MAFRVVIISMIFVGFLSTLQAADIDVFDYKGGGWIELSGTIETGDAKRVARLLQSKNWSHTAIYFSSAGGNALEGIRLGMLARTHGFTTVVGNRPCASACALAWTGGAFRLMMPKARVGYHTTYILDESNQLLRSDEGNAVVRSYVALLGLTEKAFEIMVHADPKEILWIDEKLAELAGIPYSQLDPKRDAIPYSQR